jgi:hypothetical protein
VTVGGLVKIAADLKFEVAFLSSVANSVVSFYSSGMEGGARFSGASYQCQDAVLQKNVVLPGGEIIRCDACGHPPASVQRRHVSRMRIRGPRQGPAGKPLPTVPDRGDIASLAPYVEDTFHLKKCGNSCIWTHEWLAGWACHFDPVFVRSINL